jgi:hypothetical protein
MRPQTYATAIRFHKYQQFFMSVSEELQIISSSEWLLTITYHIDAIWKKNKN